MVFSIGSLIESVEIQFSWRVDFICMRKSRVFQTLHTNNLFQHDLAVLTGLHAILAIFIR